MDHPIPWAGAGRARAVRPGPSGLAEDDYDQSLEVGIRLALARMCAGTGDWPGAIAACREAIRINPELLEARSYLIQCYLWAKEPDKAGAELETLIRFHPASREVWQQWYEQQKEAVPAGLGAAANR